MCVAVFMLGMYLICSGRDIIFFENFQENFSVNYYLKNSPAKWTIFLNRRLWFGIEDIEVPGCCDHGAAATVRSD